RRNSYKKFKTRVLSWFVYNVKRLKGNGDFNIMSEQDQAAWAIQALAALKTADNQVVVESIIKVIDDQQAEIESLRGSME
ncbi:hypothetical protein DKP78_24600, partial [Enterococcus faecium]